MSDQKQSKKNDSGLVNFPGQFPFDSSEEVIHQKVGEIYRVISELDDPKKKMDIWRLNAPILGLARDELHRRETDYHFQRTVKLSKLGIGIALFSSMLAIIIAVAGFVSDSKWQVDQLRVLEEMNITLKKILGEEKSWRIKKITD